MDLAGGIEEYLGGRASPAGATGEVKESEARDASSTGVVADEGDPSSEPLLGEGGEAGGASDVGGDASDTEIMGC